MAQLFFQLLSILLKKKNNLFIDRVSRLKLNTLDLDYLDEQLRLKTGFIGESELVIFFEY